jgi:hypothetical protein
MRPERIAVFLLGAVLLLVPTGASGQAIPLDLEIGYRFVDVDGNDDMYRSQINDREGILLRSLTFATGTVGGSFVDSLRVDAFDLGAGPAGRFRLEAGKTGLYRLRVDYRRMEFFSALPAFANPLLDRGIIPGQHTYDRTRHLLDAEVEILPYATFSPIIGYSLNRYEGPARTTYDVGGDEFRLASDLEDTEQEARIGVAFHTENISGRIVQGWRQFKETERLTLAPGEGAGNNAGPVLGTPVSITDFERDSRVRTNVPVTTAFLTGRFAGRVRIAAGYLRANSETQASETEDLTGNLVSFQISRFFRGLSEPISSRARNEQWRGHGRVEFEIVDGMDISAGYTQRHRELDGFALISSLFLDTLTFSGQDPRDLQRLIEANTALEKTEKIFDAAFDARSLGPVAVRVGYEQTDQDVRVTPDPEEIVVPGGQGGDFDRRIKSWTASANFRSGGITLGRRHRSDRLHRARPLSRARRLFSGRSPPALRQRRAGRRFERRSRDRVRRSDPAVRRRSRGRSLEAAHAPLLRQPLRGAEHDSDPPAPEFLGDRVPASRGRNLVRGGRGAGIHPLPARGGSRPVGERGDLPLHDRSGPGARRVRLHRAPVRHPRLV